MVVIATDVNSNAPAAKYADEFWNISGIDVNRLSDLAARIVTKYNLVGIHSSSDFGLQAVSSISTKHELNACTVNALKVAINKEESNQLWEKNGIACTRGKQIGSFQDAERIADHLSYPVIIKPIDCSGSQGVQSIESREQLRGALDSAMKYSKYIRIEKLLSGEHIDVNGLFVNDEFYGCGTFDVHYSNAPYHIPLWSNQPSLISKDSEDEIYSLVETGSRALGINSGPVKADVILTNAGPHLIEVTPRFQGDVATNHLTPLAYGSNPLKAYYSYLLNKEDWSKYLTRRDKNKYVGWYALFAKKSGILKNIHYHSRHENVFNTYFSANIGDKLGTPESNEDVCGFIWAHAESITQLQDLLIKESLKIEFIIE